MSTNPYGGEWADPAVQQPAAQTGLWPAGNYEGDMLGGELFSSQKKATPGIRLKFAVSDDKIVEVNCWLTDASAEMSMKALEAVGWNGDTANPDFTAVGSKIKLYMKHGSYKNKPKEEWSVSTYEQKAPPSASDPILTRFSQRFKNAVAAKRAPTPALPPRTMPPPMARPTAPLPAAAPAKAPPRPAPPPPKAPAPAPAPAPAAPPAKQHVSKHEAKTQDEAWAAWVAEGHDNADLFYDAVERIAMTNDPAAVTPEQWQKIADSIDPECPF